MAQWRLLYLQWLFNIDFLYILGDLCILIFLGSKMQKSLMLEMIHIRVCHNFPCWMLQ